MKFTFAIVCLLSAANAIKLEGRWNQEFTPDPVTNYCTNANKATGVDQACADAGNSAWNTHSSSVTKKPVDALVTPYPDHPYVKYGVKGEVYTAEEGGGEAAAK